MRVTGLLKREEHISNHCVGRIRYMFDIQLVKFRNTHAEHICMYQIFIRYLSVKFFPKTGLIKGKLITLILICNESRNMVVNTVIRIEMFQNQ